MARWTDAELSTRYETAFDECDRQMRQHAAGSRLWETWAYLRDQCDRWWDAYTLLLQDHADEALDLGYWLQLIETEMRDLQENSSGYVTRRVEAAREAARVSELEVAA